ncbi:MAG: cytoplasmic protein [Bacteroidota bacterium]
MTRSFRRPIDRMSQTIPVRVECYAGHQADEQPVRFSLFDMNFEVREVIDRWYQADTRPEFPPARYFKVQTHDGKHFMLKHVIDEDRWYLWVKGEAVHL